MLSSHGRYIFALAGLSLALVAGGVSQAYGAHRVQPAYAKAQQQPVLFQEPNCNAPKDRDEGAYCDQHAAVMVAKEQAQWALGQLVVGGLGVLAVVITIYYTRKSTKAALVAAGVALKAAADADKSLDISRQAAQASARAADAAHRYADLLESQLLIVERAYVFGGIANLQLDETKGTLSLELTVANYGKTPARVRRVDFGPVDGHGLPSMTADYSTSTAHETDTIFPAGGSGSILRLTEMPQVGVIYGRVLYLDVFSKHHESRFCMAYDWPKQEARTYGNESWNHCD